MNHFIQLQGYRRGHKMETEKHESFSLFRWFLNFLFLFIGKYIWHSIICLCLQIRGASLVIKDQIFNTGTISSSWVMALLSGRVYTFQMTTSSPLLIAMHAAHFGHIHYLSLWTMTHSRECDIEKSLWVLKFQVIKEWGEEWKIPPSSIQSESYSIPI